MKKKNFVPDGKSGSKPLVSPFKIGSPSEPPPVPMITPTSDKASDDIQETSWGTHLADRLNRKMNQIFGAQEIKSGKELFKESEVDAPASSSFQDDSPTNTSGMSLRRQLQLQRHRMLVNAHLEKLEDNKKSKPTTTTTDTTAKDSPLSSKDVKISIPSVSPSSKTSNSIVESPFIRRLEERATTSDGDTVLTQRQELEKLRLALAEHVMIERDLKQKLDLSENSRLEATQKIEELETTAETLRRRHEDTLTSLREAERKAEEAISQSNVLEQDTAESSEKQSALEQRLAEEMARNEQLQQQKRSLEIAAQTNAASAQMKMGETLVNLSTTQEDQRKAKLESEESQRRIMELKKLLQRAEDALDSTAREWKERVDATEKRCSDLELKLTKKDLEIENLRAELVQCKSDMEFADNTLQTQGKVETELRNSLRQAESAERSAHVSLSASEKEIESLQSQISALSSDKKKAADGKQEALRQMRSMKAKLDETMLERSNLLSKVELAEGRVRAIDAKGEELKSLNRQEKDLTQRLENDLSIARSDAAAAKTSVEQQVRQMQALHERIAEIQSANRKLRSELSDARAKQKKTEDEKQEACYNANQATRRAEAELHRQEQQMKQLRAEHGRLRMAVAGSQERAASAEQSRQQTQLAVAHAEEMRASQTAALMECQQELQKSNMRVMDLESNIQLLEGNARCQATVKEELEEALENARSRAVKSDRQFEELSKTYNALTLRVREFDAERKQQQQDLASRTKQLEQSESLRSEERLRHASEIEKSRVEAREAQATIQQQRRDVNFYKEQASVAQDGYDEMRRKMEEMETQLADANGALHRAADEDRQQKMHIFRSEEGAADLRMKLSEAQEEQNRERALFEQKKQEMENELKTRDAQAIAMSRSLAAAEASANHAMITMEEHRTKTQAIMADVESQLERAKEHAMDLETRLDQKTHDVSIASQKLTIAQNRIEPLEASLRAAEEAQATQRATAEVTRLRCRELEYRAVSAEKSLDESKERENRLMADIANLKDQMSLLSMSERKERLAVVQTKRDLISLRRKVDRYADEHEQLQLVRETLEQNRALSSENTDILNIGYGYDATALSLSSRTLTSKADRIMESPAMLRRQIAAAEHVVDDASNFLKTLSFENNSNIFNVMYGENIDEKVNEKRKEKETKEDTVISPQLLATARNARSHHIFGSSENANKETSSLGID
eukprot:g52.t1